MAAATTIVCMPFWSETQCEALQNTLDPDAWTEGPIYLPDSASSEASTIRSCALNASLPHGTREALERDLLELARGVFGFDLDGFKSRSDSPCVMRYTPPGDHFAWHIDNGVDAPPYGSRKLSFSIQLSASTSYTGGDLEFALYHPDYGSQTLQAQRQAARVRGTLILFPAFHMHRVTPVTQGRRDALVGWLHGPPFR